MKEIAKRLSVETWPVIDLTLKQFGLPWSDIWSGQNDAYVIEMTGKASDETLIELAKHLGFILEFPAASHIEPAFWRKGMFRLFISHLAVHKQWASHLQEALLPYGISAFVAHSDIEPATEWQDQIETALLTCDALVALLHEKFHESKWTDQEIGFAMGRPVPVCSVHFGETPYGFIGRFQAFNGAKLEPADLAAQLFETYRKNKQTKRKMADILKSWTFWNHLLRSGFCRRLKVTDKSTDRGVFQRELKNLQISGHRRCRFSVQRA
jgi:hypothetical protein